MKSYTNWIDRVPVAQLFYATIVASLYTFVVMTRAEQGLISDFNAHANIAVHIINGEKAAPPHFLYQIILITFHKIMGITLLNAGFVFVFIAVFVTYIIAFRNFYTVIAKNKYLIGLGVLFLLFSHPVALLAPLDNHLYFGYIASNVYHNPTILLLKPIALLHFILICESFNESKSAEKIEKNVIMLAILTALSIIAKPNYIIILLPAVLGIVMVNWFFLNRDVRKQVRILFLAVFIPTVVLLAWQYLWFYGGESKNSIGIGFFAVFNLLSAPWTLVPKLLLSVIFPISVAFVLGGRLMRRTDFQLSFLMFLIALVYSYVLVDGVNNKGIGHGNFFWSAQIAHFILLFVCIRSYMMFLWSEKNTPKKLKYFPLVMGMLQLISGLLWYYSNVNPDFWVPW